ncbi:MAG: DnaJ domain-containing protein [Coriobacteriales bacterium]|nr:DnaJ domain-containing protein [Coriobacteriales bacterium]
MASMNEKDYYAILEVDEKAETDEIRRAFQKKARKLHPDVNKEPDAEERFKEVSEAYAVLSDKDKRARYDAMRSGAPFAGGYPGGSAGGYGGYGGSPFGSGFPFGGGGRRASARGYNPRAGGDVTYQIDLDAKSANAGTKRGVTYQRYATCQACNGQGSVEHSEPTTCPTCGGAGRMRIDMGGLGIFGIGFMEVTCPECEGSGRVVVDPCSSCGGSGRVLTASEVIINIPPHSHDGDEVRVEGMGNAGTNGREAGAFVCHVSVAEEHVSPQQEASFRLAGFGIPFLVIGLLQPSISSMAIVGGVLLLLGLFMALREGAHKNGRWWGAAGAAILGGASTGLIIGLLFMFSGPFIYSLAPIIFIVLIFSMMSRRIR